ncbi:MAG: GNVR domain-containing protein [Rhodocyclaceae bacterium]
MNHDARNVSTYDEEIDFVVWFKIINARRGFVFAFTATVAIAAIVVSILLPKQYTGSVRLLPPQQNQSSMMSSLAGLGAGSLSGAAGVLGIKNPNDMYVGILKSRTVADGLIARYKLADVYKTNVPEETRASLAASTTISSGKDNLIEISVLDRNPARAADLANGYVDELYKLTTTLAVTEAAQRRVFFERQLTKTRQDLSVAEIAFKEMQQRTGLLMLDEQGKVVVESISRLRGQIAAKEAQFVAMGEFATADNPDIRRIKTEIVGLKEQLAKLQRQGGSGEGVLFSAGNVPQDGLEYVRRMRDLKYQEALFEQLAKQVELARVDEARDTSIVQVLDKAVVPQKQTKPKRALIVVFATLLGFVAACGWVFVRAGLQKGRNGLV